MSRRRLQRAGARREARGAVPVELADPWHDVWTSAEDVDELAAVHGLTMRHLRTSPLRDPVWQRFRAFRREFCESHGLMSSRWPDSLDWERIGEAGIYAADRLGISR